MRSISPSRTLRRRTLLAIFLLTIAAISLPDPGHAQDKKTPCTEDAMIVFDASGSMAGNLGQGIMTEKPRIYEVRKALARVLPEVTRVRKVGLITYGPGLTGSATYIWIYGRSRTPPNRS